MNHLFLISFLALFSLPKHSLLHTESNWHSQGNKRNISIITNKKINTTSLEGYFAFDCTKNFNVTTPAGMFINIPANTFLAVAGKSMLQLKVTEMLEIPDLFVNGVVTVHDKMPLATGGIINLKVVTAEGQEVMPVETANILIEIPHNAPVEGMRLAVESNGNASIKTGIVEGKVLTVPGEWTFLSQNIGVKMPGRLVSASVKGGKPQYTNAGDALGVKSGYAFSVNQTGWFFLYLKMDEIYQQELLYPIEVNIKNSDKDARVFIFIPRLNAIITPISQHGKKFEFVNIPEKEDLKIVSFRLVSKDNVMLFVKYLKPQASGLKRNDSYNIDVILEPASIDMLKLALESY